MKRLFLTLLFASSLVSCSYVLEIDMPEFTPQIVMNSFICPDKEVVVAFTWSRSVADDIDDIENTTAISGSATLFENEIELATEQLFSGEGSAYVKFYHTPAEGCHYRVVANIDSYGEVSAETYIPKSCTVSVEITKQLLLPGQMHSVQ